MWTTFFYLAVFAETHCSLETALTYEEYIATLKTRVLELQQSQRIKHSKSFKLTDFMRFELVIHLPHVCPWTNCSCAFVQGNGLDPTL